MKNPKIAKGHYTRLKTSYDLKHKTLMNENGMHGHDLLNANRLLSSEEVMYLGGIKSHTTLIKMEREGDIKVARRIGNRKRYAPLHIKRVFGL